MDNSQTLELQIKSKAQEAKASVESLVKSLTNVENTLTNIYLELGSIEKKADSSINKATISATKGVNQLKQATDKTTSSASKLGNTFKNIFTFAGAKKLTLSALGWANEAIDYSEQLNLFNVVFDNTEKNGKQMFSELGKSATQFQYKLNEVFGTNKTQTLYMQGIFQSMGENQGISDYYAGIMSETMTKFTYDLASLYNKTEKTTAEALRASVYAGMTKPARSYGLDVTQQSMQPILNDLGIDKQVKNLSQAEKMILRYISVLKQGQVAMGDLASTIESPSNQLKIFNQQLIETKVAFSSLFMGTLSSALPYANAFLMVIKEISKALATMFGIELKDYNSGIASQEGIYDGIADSVDDATGSVKELKRQTLGFDEIHNINENNNSGTGTSVSGGIDQRLLDAITGYDNGMDKVKMKATEIRDRIMEWLGFTKEIDPLTGEVSFKYNGIKIILKNIWKSFKDLNTQSKIFVGLGLYLVVSKLFDNIKKLNTISGTSGLLGLTKKMLSPMKSLYKSLDDVNFANKTLTQGLNEGITNWSKSLTMSEKFRVSLVGILGLSTSMEGMKNAMKSVSDEGWNLGNSLQAVISGIGGIASGAYIGSIFGPWGTVIGGATSALALLINATSSYQTETDKMISKIETSSEKMLKFGDSVMAVYGEIDNTVKNKLSLHEENQKLVDELCTLVDANGNVLSGYEDRVSFILNQLNNAYGTEYKIVDGQIKKYNELKKNIQELIKQKQIEIILEGKTEAYTKAVEVKSELLNKYREQKENIKKLQKEYDLTEEKMEKLISQYSYGKISLLEYNMEMENLIRKSADLKQAIDDENGKLAEFGNDVVENQKIISDYTELSTASITGNMDDIDGAISRVTNSYVVSGKVITNSLAENINNLDIQYKELETMTEEEYNRQKKNLLDTLVHMSQTVDSMTPEIVEAWGYLAENSESEFLEKFKTLPKDVQTEIVDKMYNKGYDISHELQSGINQINPTIKFKVDTKEANNTINSWLNGIAKGLTVKVTGKANGGIYSNGSWKDIPQYANGGAPSHGSLVFAGENGPEILGNANGKTEILNKSQIASSIYSAVYSAMSQFNMGGVAEINVRADKGIIVETAIDGINQKTRQTGVCPVDIPIC